MTLEEAINILPEERDKAFERPRVNSIGIGRHFDGSYYIEVGIDPGERERIEEVPERMYVEKFVDPFEPEERIRTIKPEIQPGNHVWNSESIETHGTISAIVDDMEKGLCILSCQHILQPKDTTTKEILVNKTHVANHFKNGPSSMDIALASVKEDKKEFVNPFIREINAIPFFMSDPEVGMIVQKCGAETDLTFGRVRLICVFLKRKPDAAPMFEVAPSILDDDSFIHTEDSGALIMKKEPKNVALGIVTSISMYPSPRGSHRFLFGAFAQPIIPIAQHFNFSFTNKT